VILFSGFPMKISAVKYDVFKIKKLNTLIGLETAAFWHPKG
jgi:hypothetical protein